MRVKYEYTTIYNFRPGELFGMGKESLIVSGETDLESLFETLHQNSSLKHEDIKQWIVGTNEYVEMDEWKKWVGQPMFWITDIKIENVEDAVQV